MAEIVNLRTARKRAARQREEKQADANRLAHGVPRAEREREAAARDIAERHLSGHRLEGGGHDQGNGE